jgi:hypothetical protein|tara:strand:- start:237 stop:866 length:630 start_codon:yes stop_codon:yes gene_type:complete
MSFRFEEKTLFHISDYLKLKTFIFNSGGIELYPKRKISSLYFDNHENNMYLDSEDGCLPRKKIRIRTYPENKNDSEYFSETKISSVEGRYKIVNKINKKNYINLQQKGFFDNIYGMCYPKIRVSYFREYFSLFNQRITLDQDIQYKCYKSNRYMRDKECIILEIKSNNMINVDLLTDIVPFQRLRISKYCDGFNKLFNSNENQRLNQLL